MMVAEAVDQTHTNDRQPRLPTTWQGARLGDVGKIGSGITLGRKLQNVKTTPVPYLRVANVKDGHLDLSDVYEIDATEADIAKCRLQYGDLLLTEGGDPDKLGRGSFWEDQLPLCLHQNHIFRVRFNLQEFSPQFLAAEIGSPYGKAYFLAHAKQTTGIATINQQVLAAFPLMFPPLPEQKRIAALLTEQMAAVEQARAAAKAQLAAAQALPAAYLRAIYDSVEARRWLQRRLGDVLTLRKEVVHPHDNPHGPATFVGLEHIESGTGRRIGSIAVEMSELTGRKPQFRAGDVVYGYLRPYLNKVWVADFDGLCSVDQYVYSINTAHADTNFIAWFMRSPLYLERAPIDTMPGQLPRIRTEEVASVEVNLPPLAEQRRVVALITEKTTAARQAREALEAQLTAINDLPAALLRQAFRGEL